MPGMHRSLFRLVVGFGLVAVAVVARCFALAPGARLAHLGPYLPAVTQLDLLTGPLALAGVAVVAGAPGLSSARRSLGTVALVAAIGWPAIQFGNLSPVVLRLSADHGVHLHDVVLMPFLAGALLLLQPARGQTVRPRKQRNSVWTSAPSGASVLAPNTPGTRIMASIGLSPE